MSEERIDDVNVAECERLWNGQCTDKDNKLLGNCIDLDCEHKQLKRLQAENEQLKKEIKTYDKAQYEEFKRAEEYHKENEELKNIIKVNDSTKYDYYKLMQENEQLKESNLQLQTIDMEIDRNNKYKQALEDIREIIDFRFRTAYMTFGFKEYDKLIEDIDKITNEVLK